MDEEYIFTGRIFRLHVDTGTLQPRDVDGIILAGTAHDNVAGLDHDVPQVAFHAPRNLGAIHRQIPVFIDLAAFRDGIAFELQGDLIIVVAQHVEVPGDIVPKKKRNLTVPRIGLYHRYSGANTTPRLRDRSRSQ